MLGLHVHRAAASPARLRPPPTATSLHLWAGFRVIVERREGADHSSGIRVTTVARTLVDLADELSRRELRAAFAKARELGMLDLAAVEASAARVEWRPSLPLLRSVMAEFQRDAA